MTTHTPRPPHDAHRRPLARTLTAVSGVALAGLLTLTACSGEADPAEFTDNPTGAAQDAGNDGGSGTEAGSGASDGSSDPASAGGETAGEGTGEGGDAPGAQSSTVDPADAMETITYDIPNAEIDGTMTVGLHHLERRGQTMELLLTFTPEFTGHEAYSLWDLHAKNHALVPPALFDRENLKRYDILRYTGGYDNGAHWSSTQAEIDLASGDTQSYWATFAAPEDEIDTINVAVPAGPEFQDVKIESTDGAGADAATDSGEGGDS